MRVDPAGDMIAVETSSAGCVGFCTRHWSPGLAALVAIAVTGLVSDAFRSSPGSEVRGSGAAASEARAVPAFDRVELSGSSNVVIRVGLKQRVVVHTDDNLVGRVMTSVEGRTLVVGDEPGRYTTKSPTYVEITIPSL